MTPEELRSFIEAQDAELKRLVTRSEGEVKELGARVLGVEQLITSRGGTGGGGGFGGGVDESIGDAIVKSEGFRQLVGGARSSGRIPFKSLTPRELKIISGTWSAAPDFRPLMAFPPQPSLPVRALLPNIPTTSNLVEFPVEASFTNAANYQIPEGTDKPQSDATYTLTQMPVATIAHWIPASRQLLDDSDAFRNYINARMVFKLEQVIEQEILFGTGAAGHLKGIWPSATPATEAQTGLADSVGASLGQLAALGIAADAVVVNPQDWWSARLTKASTAGTYLYGDPLTAQRPSLWGLNVALAVSMPVGSYLVGNFAQGAAVYDRQQNILEVSREHASFFVQNMIAILVESRLAVCVFVPTAFVRGSIGPGS